MSLPVRERVAGAFGRVLKIVRDTAGLSQEKLAEHAEIDQTYCSLLERGERCPNFWMLLKLAHALDIDPVLMVSMTLAILRDDV